MSVDRGVNSATEAFEDATSGVRMRHPSVTINQPQVTYERNRRLATLAHELHQRFRRNLRPVQEQASDLPDEVRSVALG